MSDYINYIDFRAIKLGDLANKIGDYKCAIDSYSKALRRLQNYQGDRMQPIMMASELANKIKEISKKKVNEKTILNFDTWKLTKSSFVKGSQCVKYLYLDKHKKNEKTPISKVTQDLFDKGHLFEDLVRKTEFPEGVNVKDVVGNFAYFNSYTKYLVNSSGQQIIYEATIIENDVLVMCDVLIKHGNGLIDIYEIKLNIELNEAIINDLSIQYLICKKRFPHTLNTFNVIYRSEKNENNKEWKIQNLKDLLEKNALVTEDKMKAFKDILENSEPSISMGAQCNNPYECEFIEYCKNKC